MGLIGVGGRGSSHLETLVALQEKGKVDIVGVCELDKDRLATAVEASGAPGFDDAVKLMDEAKPDYIATIVSNSVLQPLCEAAAERGIHMATETPIASNLPVATKLIETAKSGGIKLENFEQSWRWPREYMKRNLIASGVMGKIIQARFFSYIAPYHAMGVFLKLGGSKVKRVVAVGRDLPTSPYQKEGPYSKPRRWVAADVEFENGTPGFVETKTRLSYVSGHDFTNCSADCENGHFIHDDIYIMDYAVTPKEGGAWEDPHMHPKGMLKFPIQERYDTIDGTEVLTKIWIDIDADIAWENPTPDLMPKKKRASADDYARTEEHLSFIHAVENDTEPEYTWQEAYHNIEVLIAAHHSAENGNIVMELPMDPTIETSFW